jgi:hypothetical protein
MRCRLLVNDIFNERGRMKVAAVVVESIISCLCVVLYIIWLPLIYIICMIITLECFCFNKRGKRRDTKEEF